MLSRLTSFLLIAALGATLYAGTPLHGGGADHCRPHGMSDCCELARSHEKDPEVLAAKLCCALNCAQPGPTGPTLASRPHALPRAVPPHPAAAPLPIAENAAVELLFRRARAGPRAATSPPYLQHLALLI